MGLCTSALAGHADLKAEVANSPPKFAPCLRQCRELQKNHHLITSHISQDLFHLWRVIWLVLTIECEGKRWASFPRLFLSHSSFFTVVKETLRDIKLLDGQSLGLWITRWKKAIFRPEELSLQLSKCPNFPISTSNAASNNQSVLPCFPPFQTQLLHCNHSLMSLTTSWNVNSKGSSEKNCRYQLHNLPENATSRAVRSITATYASIRTSWKKWALEKDPLTGTLIANMSY